MQKKQNYECKKNAIKGIVTCILIVFISGIFCQSANAEKKQYIKYLKVNKNVTVEVGEKEQVKPVIKGTKKTSKKIVVKSKNKKIAKVKYNTKKNIITIVGVEKGMTTIVVETKGKNKKGKKIRKKIKVKVVKEELTEATTEKTTESTTEPTTENPAEETEKVYDASGDGWYLLNGVLRLSNIYYSIHSLADGYYVDYETPWSEYADEITNIIIDADVVYKGDAQMLLDNYKEIFAEDKPVKEETLLFANLDSLKYVTITRLKLDQMTDVSYMFAYNENLTYVSIDGFDMSGIKNASYMFANNTSLSTINLQKINTSDLVTAAGMFQGCTNLSSVSVSAWDTSNIKDFSHMFEGCKSLTSVDLNGWTIDDADVSAMFDDCEALKEVELTNVSLKNTIAANSMFNENNSITSYEFAEQWDIFIDRDKCIWPIGDDCYYTIPTMGMLTTQSSVTIEYVHYKKNMPSWYKKGVEYVQAIDEFNKIVSSPELDVYMDISQNDASELKLSDLAGAVSDVIVNYYPETEEESELLNTLLQKLELMQELKERKVKIDDFIALLDWTIADLEKLLEEE